MTKHKDQPPLQQYLSILNSVTLAVAVIDKQGRIVFWNEVAEKEFGYAASLMLNKPISDIFAGGGETLEKEVQLAATTKQESLISKIIVRSQGQELHDCLATIKPLQLPESTEKYWVINFSLREEQFRSLLNNLPDIVIIHQDGLIRYLNNAAATQLALTDLEVIGEHILRFVHPDDHPKIIESMLMRKKGQEVDDYEIRIQLNQQEHRIAIIRTKSILFDGQVSTLTILIDITERKQVEEALRESEEKFRLLAESTPFAILIYQGDYFVYTNPAGLTITGLEKEELLSTPYYEIVAPEYADLIKTRGKDRQAGNAVPLNYEFQIRHKNGEKRWVFLTGTRIHYNGQPAGLVSVTDITSRKQSEEKIEEHANRLKAILNALPDLLFVMDEQGNYIEYYANEVNTLAVPSEKIVGSNISMLFDAEETQRQLSYFRQCLHQQETVSYEYDLLFNNQLMRYEARLSPIDNRRVLVIIRDISKRHQLQLQLDYRSALQNLLTRLANRFINIEGKNLNDMISQALSEIGMFTQVDRVYIFDYNWEKLTLTNTYEWCAEGISSELHRNQNLPQSEFAEWVELHKRGEIVYVPDFSVFEPDSYIRKLMEPQGIQSLTIIPMMSGGKCIGFVGFDSVRKKRKWNESETDILRLFADLLANVAEKADVLNRLHESEAINAFITANIADAVMLTDRAGKYTYVSPSHQRIMGRGQELLGRSVYEFVHPDDRGKVIDMLRKGRNADEQFSVEYRYLHPQKGYIWMESIGRRYFDDKKEIFGLVTSRDINARKTIELELNKLSRAIEHSPNSIFITDIDGQIEYVNPAFSQVTGYAPEEVLGKNPSILKSGYTKQEEYAVLWSTIRAGKTWKGTFRTLRKDGSYLWESVFISPVMDAEGKITNFLAIKEDITEQKRIRAELIAAKERAEESDRLKTAFINNISHEIRTPLNGILGFSELLADNTIEEEEKKEFLASLDQSSERLLNTINDIIEVSLLVSGNKKVMPVPFDFLVLVNDLYQKYLPEFTRKNIVFTLEMATSTRQIQCRTDRFMVQQMLEELLSNAAKFTEKGKVELDISMADGFITVILSDTGCGIPREHQNRIFDFFRQVDSSSSRKHEGSGLGLSIVKGMTELLGGAICLDSEVGRGTVFTIIVPVVYDESTASELVHEAIDKSKKSKKVLIVEDDITNYKYLFRVLKPNQRKRSVWVVDGDQAIRDCQTDQDIGLVLMDIKLPGIDGLEATRKIKQLRPDLPIVAVTAYAMEADRDKALAAGCDAYISKPFTRDELHQLLDKFGLDT